MMGLFHKITVVKRTYSMESVKGELRADRKMNGVMSTVDKGMWEVSTK